MVALAATVSSRATVWRVNTYLNAQPGAYFKVDSELVQLNASYTRWVKAEAAQVPFVSVRRGVSTAKATHAQSATLAPYLPQYGTTAIDTGGGGGGPILFASKNIDSAQILALHTTPVEILPAPGGRFYYVPLKAIAHHRFVSTPYEVPGSFPDLILGAGSEIAEVIANTFVYPTSTFDFSAGQLEDFYDGLSLFEGFWAASVIEDAPISIALTEQVTDGDGTLTVRLFYSLIDGAP